MAVPTRDEVDEGYRWDLGSLFGSDEGWEDAYERADRLVDEVSDYEGCCTEDAETLLETMEAYEEMMRTVSNVASYARMRRDEDTTRDRYKAAAARARSLSSEATSAASFIEPEVQDAGRDRVEEMMDELPELAVYSHYFDDVLRTKEHTRSPEVEDLLAKLGEVTGAPGEVYDNLTNADMEFPVVEDPEGDERQVTLNSFTKLQKHTDANFGGAYTRRSTTNGRVSLTPSARRTRTP